MVLINKMSDTEQKLDDVTKDLKKNLTILKKKKKKTLKNW